MCRLLEVSRSLVYYHLNKEESDASDEESKVEKHIIDIFHKSRNNYGTRKIKVELDSFSVWTLINHEIDLKVFHRRIQKLLNYLRHPVYFIDKEYIPWFKRCK